MTEGLDPQAQSLMNELGIENFTPPTPPTDTPITDTPIVDTPIVETPVVETPVVTDETIVETPVVTDTPAPTFDFTKYGVANEEELSQRLNELGELKGKWGEVEKELKVLEQVKSPFANDTIRQINNFSKETGITDLQLVTSIIGTSKEDLSKNPIKAIAINMIMENPKLGQLGLEALEDAVAKKNGIDLEDTRQEGFEYPTLLKIDAITAVDAIEEKKLKNVNGNDFFVDLQNKATEQQRLSAENLQKWDTILPSVGSPIKAITRTVDTGVEGVGSISVNVAVSQEEVNQAIETYKSMGVLNQFSPDEKGVTALREIVESNLRLAKVDSLIVEAVKAAEGKIKESVVKASHNIAPVTQRPAPAPTTKVIDPASEALDKILKGQML